MVSASTQTSQKAKTPLEKPDPELQYFSRIRQYVQTGRMPWRRLVGQRRERIINESMVTRGQAGDFKGKPFPLHKNHFLGQPLYQRAVFERFAEDIQHASISSLHDKAPHLSAQRLFSTGEKFGLAFIMLSLTALFVYWPLTALITLNAFATAYFLCIIIFRLYLLFLSAAAHRQGKAEHFASDTDLPVITILLPLFKDSALLPSLSQAIDRLDYPPEKKDVKLLFEENDVETIREARRLGLDQHYEMIIAPECAPQTKPKACNFGMHLARGELIVIYDAEDQPEHDQLRKAAAAFADGDDQLACVQAKLNYYNARDNWLTRLFTLEYSLWFDWLLPALQKMGAPIPLGGTSNFFRTDILIEVGGWDPYNVTEDADLGLRLAKLGYRTEILDSTTYEEANSRTGNWIRQRSRWMKGHLQTWIVHMRRPGEIVAHTGWKGLLSVQLFLAGNVFSALINPVLWALFVAWLVFQPHFVSTLFPEPLLHLNLFALIFGNALFILLMVIAPLKRGWYGLSLAGFTAPVYWLLASIAGYKAVWQLIFRPHFWEKTDHLISPAAQQKRDDALRDMKSAPSHRQS